MRTLWLSMLLCLTMVACATGPAGPVITRSVGTSRPPELSETGAVYQRPGPSNVDSLLTVLLGDALAVSDVWNPIGGSLCMSPNGTDNTIVRLAYPDTRIARHGFSSDARGMSINCGVMSFEHYQVR